MKDSPLAGKKVLITRSKSQASKMARFLEELGAIPIAVSTIKIMPPDSYEEMDEAANQLSSSAYDWVIFTSANGVVYFVERLKQLAKDAGVLKSVKIAAIGPATALELEKIGLKTDFVPQEFRAEAVVAGLRALGIKGQKILIPRAKVAREILPESLKESGAYVDVVPVYQTVPDESQAIKVIATLKSGVDFITFTSSSTVKNFVGLLEEVEIAKLLGRAKVACIGPITAQTANELGLAVDIVASDYTIEGLVKALTESVGS